jgi:hypothetical protein
VDEVVLRETGDQGVIRGLGQSCPQKGSGSFRKREEERMAGSSEDWGR